MSNELSPRYKMIVQLLGANLKIPKPADTVATLVVVLLLLPLVFAGILTPPMLAAAAVGAVSSSLIERPADGRSVILTYPLAWAALVTLGLVLVFLLT